jgi:acyl-CoA dehydrogenase
VRDFSAYATGLHGKPGNTGAQRALIRDLIQAPVANAAQFDRIWREHVYALTGQQQGAFNSRALANLEQGFAHLPVVL